jgi:hypothetical protein
MHLKSNLIVKESLADVIEFFYHPSSLAQWDRSVAEMIPQSQGTEVKGATFDTVAPSGMKMTYEVIEIDPSGRSVKILLTKSKMFKKAIWHFELEPSQQGTKVTCHIYFTLKPLYSFLYPVLFFNKKALLRDLKFFEMAVDDFTEKRKGATIEKASQS